jgi:adhesin/invasin
MGHQRINASILLVVIAALGSCSAPPAGIKVGPAARLDIVSGDNQSAIVGTELSQPLVARVVDANGNPVVGQVVNFHVTKGNGSVFAGSGLTNANGIAQERWTLGTSTADSQVVEARAVDSNTGAPLVFGEFTAIALPGPAASVAINAGDGQGAQIGTAVSIAPSVKVMDSYGNPVPNAPVTFSVASGGGAITGATPKSDRAGIAAVGSWTLGMTEEFNYLSANATGSTGSPVTFTAYATPGPATTMAMVGGDNQSQLIGTYVCVPPSVRVTDAYGNAVSDVSVTFAVTSGGGTIQGANAVTNSFGVAAVGSWVLGWAIDTPNTLSASSSGLNGSPVTFTATAVGSKIPCSP